MSRALLCAVNHFEDKSRYATISWKKWHVRLSVWDRTLVSSAPSFASYLRLQLGAPAHMQHEAAMRCIKPRNTGSAVADSYIPVKIDIGDKLKPVSYRFIAPLSAIAPMSTMQRIGFLRSEFASTWVIKWRCWSVRISWAWQLCCVSHTNDGDTDFGSGYHFQLITDRPTRPLLTRTRWLWIKYGSFSDDGKILHGQDRQALKHIADYGDSLCWSFFMG